MAIQKEFVVRYRVAGHVRFEIPQRATHAQAAQQLTEQLSQLDGVYAAKLFRGSRKLSIHYDESVCSFIDLARQLHRIVGDIEQQGGFNPQVLAVTASSALKHKFKQSRVGRWLDDKIVAAKETAQAAKVVGKLASKGPKSLVNDPEKAVIDFLNDILVLYLIKIHWSRITQQWLVKPWLHRYEWAATFYMFFLLVRSRKPK